MLLFLTGKGDCAVHHTGNTGGTFKADISVSINICGVSSEELCRRGDAGGITETQPQQGIDCPQLGNYTATK